MPTPPIDKMLCKNLITYNFKTMPGKDKNKKIIKAGDANVPNAANIMKKKGLGPAMFPIKKAKQSGRATNVVNV